MEHMIKELKKIQTKYEVLAIIKQEKEKEVLKKDHSEIFQNIQNRDPKVFNPNTIGHMIYSIVCDSTEGKCAVSQVEHRLTRLIRLSKSELKEFTLQERKLIYRRMKEAVNELPVFEQLYEKIIDFDLVVRESERLRMLTSGKNKIVMSKGEEKKLLEHYRRIFLFYLKDYLAIQPLDTFQLLRELLGIVKLPFQKLIGSHYHFFNEEHLQYFTKDEKERYLAKRIIFMWYQENKFHFVEEPRSNERNFKAIHGCCYMLNAAQIERLKKQFEQQFATKYRKIMNKKHNEYDYMQHQFVAQFCDIVEKMTTLRPLFS